MFSKELRRKIKTSRKIKILIVLVTIILIVLMFPKGESLESDVSINSIWIQEDLIASRTFEILKSPEVYNRERIEAADAVAPIFLKDVQVEQTNLDSMRKYNTYLLQLIDQDNFFNVPAESNFTFLSEPSYETFKNIRRRENILSTPNSLSLSNILKATLSILSSIYNEDVLDVIYEDIDKDSISIRQGKFEELLPKEKFLDMNSVKTRINLLVANTFGNYKELNDAAAEYIFHFIQPTLIYNQSITEETKTISRDKVTKNVGIVNENERIVAKHDRITPEIKLMIDSYRIAKGEERSIGGIIAQNVGKFLHIIIILTLFIIYIYLFRKKIFDDNLKIILILIIILLISFIAFLIYQINVKAPVELLILVPVASMLLTIIFDSRVGFYGTIVVALITGGLRGNDYVFAVMNILAGGLAAYTVRDIKNRTQIFRSFLFILIGYIASITAFGLERFDSAENILLHSAFAASNALISPVLTYGLIIFFERIFKITTELTLLELSDFNTTLLKDLAKNAPGTFTHSMTIGSMVENAAETIGASPILARVGAYYHDIGKILNPDGFVENQLDNKNLHDSIEPEQSAKIIVDHVNEGINLAKKHKLPQEVIKFIPMHHGTMAVSYFYEKAKEEYGEDKIDINNFRYPGPKPDSKETALLMMADACESTVRSMSDPDAKKIENVVNNIIKLRVDDGQLDEAPITMRDITLIKESFFSILLSQHHKRIRYPEQEKIENESNDIEV